MTFTTEHNKIVIALINRAIEEAKLYPLQKMYDLPKLYELLTIFETEITGV
jgi:hypothetical protein